MPESDFHLRTTTAAYAAWQAATGHEAELLERIALTPQAFWVGDWLDVEQVAAEVGTYTAEAAADGTIALLVLYAVPGRDCGSFSAGGLTPSAYGAWVDSVAGAIKGETWVILEPDALPQVGRCADQGDRVGLLREAALTLTEAGARVYLDIGHSDWLSMPDAVDLLERVGLEHAAGFALNTSNYGTTADERAYGRRISRALDDVGFVIDVSRNARGSNGDWCNPAGRGLGDTPRLVRGAGPLEALLWVKAPGESDGTCNGGPPAGEWWQERALELSRNG